MLCGTACPDKVGISRHSGEKYSLRKYCLIIFSLVLVFKVTGIAQTDIPAGNVSGTWTKVNSPYHINGEVTIPNDSILTIEPGVEVIFTGHHKFKIQGRLLAVGTQQDSIRFIAENTQSGWHGIRFLQTPNTNDTSKMVYCSFKYGKANTGSGLDRCGGAILIQSFDKVLISDCLFDSNLQVGESWTPPYYEAGPAIYFIYSSPVITNSTFTNNEGHKSGAITCLNSPSAVISNNFFTKNRGMFGPIVNDFPGSPTITDNVITNNFASNGPGGILVYNGATPTISRNIISYNSLGGIAAVYNSKPRIENNIIIHNYEPGVNCMDNSNAVLINNTIAFNYSSSWGGGGIRCSNNSDPIFINNIIYKNSATIGNQVYIDDASSDPSFVYCDIEGGKEAFGGNGAGANYNGTYENNIYNDPLFMDTTSDDYCLSDSSPCIGAGSMTIKVGADYYHPATFCIMGNPRPSPFNTNPDIGACENLLGSPTGVEQEPTNPTEFVLYQNYPNPFNPSTTVGYVLQEKSNAKLTLLNVIGEEIAILANEEQDKGYHKVEFDGSNLSSGVYFYRIQAGNFINTKKMVLLQ